MSQRYIYTSFITTLNRSFKCHPHSVYILKHFASNFSTNLYDRASYSMVNQKLQFKPSVSNVGIPVRANLNCRVQSNLLVSQCRRWKHTKSKKPEQEDEEDDDQFYMDSKEENIGKTSSVFVPSLRIDVVLKTGFGYSRNKVEELFYQSRVRVNEQKITKKSASASLGDCIDIVKGMNPNTDRYIDVMRLHIIGIKLPKAPQTKLELKVKREKLLTIENYEDAWQGVYM